MHSDLAAIKQTNIGTRGGRYFRVKLQLCSSHVCTEQIRKQGQHQKLKPQLNISIHPAHEINMALLTAVFLAEANHWWPCLDRLNTHGHKPAMTVTGAGITDRSKPL